MARRRIARPSSIWARSHRRRSWSSSGTACPSRWQAGEFMSGCSTNWGAYLTSLKTGAETDAFAAYPAGEISRWD